MRKKGKENDCLYNLRIITNYTNRGRPYDSQTTFDDSQ